MTLEKYPRISIITPSKNQGQFIDQTIQSVLMQGYPDLEYIVMDGGSSDNTIDILKKYSDRLTWVSEEDSGQANAINKGMKIATGEIVAYLNADDILLSRSLFKVAEAFYNDPKAMWLTGQCRIIDEQGAEIRKPITIYKNILLRMRGMPLLLVTNYISQPSTFWRRELITMMGLLDEDFHYAMDYEYWLRFYAKYPPIFVPKYLAAFKIHQSSKTTSSGHKREYIDEEKRIIMRHGRLKLFLILHNVHRLIMSSTYSLINQKR
jgi:glycosyltransferase involved in cell wall biosynthesis